MQIIAGAAESSARWTDRLADWIVSGIALVLPRFDLMTQTAWLVVQPPAMSALGNVLLQTALYTLLLVAAAQFDLHRENF
jgi:hypothetical protein